MIFYCDPLMIASAFYSLDGADPSSLQACVCASMSNVAENIDNALGALNMNNSTDLSKLGFDMHL